MPWAQHPFARRIVRHGHPKGYLRDLYIRLLHIKWRYLLMLYALVFLSINLTFALAYHAAGDCIQGARPGSFHDAFFFSVQTISTVGYGVLSPKGLCGNSLVFVETMCGLLGLAMATGIVFSKFSLPSSGVVFSNKAIIAPRNGQSCLIFRLANARGSDIVEASLRVTTLKDETTAEGERLRRMVDLPLERSQSPVLFLSWLVIHRIDHESPLYGLSLEEIKARQMRIITTLTGIDGAFSQMSYVYHVYEPEDLVMGGQFEDVVLPQPDGGFILDLTRFHAIRRSNTDIDPKF
jgi:inward rectifier potassium channel